MTPQSTFMILAPIAEGRDASLRALLASMNISAGMADPANTLVPFGQFERLHVRASPSWRRKPGRTSASTA
jgi:hypothetical protein